MINVRQLQVRAKYIRVGDFCPNGGWVMAIAKSTTGEWFNQKHFVTLTFLTGDEWVECTLPDFLPVDVERLEETVIHGSVKVRHKEK